MDCWGGESVSFAGAVLVCGRGSGGEVCGRVCGEVLSQAGGGEELEGQEGATEGVE